MSYLAETLRWIGFVMMMWGVVAVAWWFMVSQPFLAIGVGTSAIGFGIWHWANWLAPFEAPAPAELEKE